MGVLGKYRRKIRKKDLSSTRSRSLDIPDVMIIHYYDLTLFDLHLVILKRPYLKDLANCIDKMDQRLLRKSARTWRVPSFPCFTCGKLRGVFDVFSIMCDSCV